MDTAWFAIDNDGNVAIFSTGESGCVPTDAYVEDYYNLEQELTALPSNGFKYDLEGLQATRWSDHMEVEDIPQTASGEPAAEGIEMYMFLSDLVPVSDLLARLNATELEATTHKCVRLNVTDRAAFAELHAREACMGCYRDYREANDIATHGVFNYDHTCENWIAGPYARVSVPKRPLTIKEIPQSVRDKAIAYNGKFSETPKLQPAEHWECQSWESGWLSSDGKTARPFADMTDSWGDYAADREGDGDGGIQFVNEPLEDLPPHKKRWWK
jgi:hypothetical protein